MPRLSRACVVVAAAMLLLSSAFAPRLRADRTPEPAFVWPPTFTCSQPQLVTTGTSTTTITTGGAVAQPFLMTSNFGVCSLAVVPVLNTGKLRISQWDAANVMPDPTTVALRSILMSNSTTFWVAAPITMLPPVITRAFDHVADPPGALGAIELIAWYSQNSFTLSYDPASTSGLPTGYSRTAMGAYTPLPGERGVLAMRLCGGDTRLQSVRVAQCVMHAGVVEDGATHEFLQRFRVPRAVRARWVEVAADGYTSQPYPSCTIAILDAANSPGVPATLPPPLVQTTFYPVIYEPSWISPYEFDSTVVLQPGHDYWLRVVTGGSFRLRAHDGANAPGFDPQDDIGPLFSRVSAAGEFLFEDGRALSFRLIGDAGGLVDAAPVVPRARFELRATPNPAHGATTLAWTGARGAVRCDVLDARGRRVDGSDALPEGTRQWNWNASRAGRPIAPGLYFVRAVDADGREALARVVVIR